jgi:hypothetical protein
LKKKSDVLWSLLFYLVLDYVNMRVKVNQKGLKLNCAHELKVYAHCINIIGRDVNTVGKSTESLKFANKVVDLEVNAEEIKYMVMSRDQHARQNHYININNNFFERM